MKQVVIYGAGGPVGCALIEELIAQDETIKIIAVGRDAGKLQQSRPEIAKLPQVQFSSGDVLNKARTVELAKNCDTLFCAVGIPYKNSTWKLQWPIVAENLVAAAEDSKAALIFADNLYSFGPDGTMPLQESAPSETKYGVKPKVRAEIRAMMLKAHEEGRCKVAFVRSSDFFGPRVTLSGLGDQVFPKVLSKASPMFVGANPSLKHDFTYVPDFAKLLVAVAKDETSLGRSWHVPNAPTKTLTELTEEIFKRAHDGSVSPKKPQILSGPLLTVLSWFIPGLSAMKEMLYAWSDGDYIVDSSEAEQKFGIQATSWDESLDATISWYKNK